jgi:hypothetical protein
MGCSSLKRPPLCRCAHKAVPIPAQGYRNGPNVVDALHHSKRYFLQNSGINPAPAVRSSKLSVSWHGGF